MTTRTLASYKLFGTNVTKLDPFTVSVFKRLFYDMGLVVVEQNTVTTRTLVIQRDDVPPVADEADQPVQEPSEGPALEEWSPHANAGLCFDFTDTED